ncbi:hypothetical protein DPMN_114263 [Dreissena polymorpha]|uniref:Cyclic nucleotide-binding domain-containing protein n=1 Tax=Dreissena polymorpha TaxID=45954 RepID=A0A9D4KK71_DREPO|nr:hypothetical protein DPMN_114263 [Dreissena polymorpha]
MNGLQSLRRNSARWPGIRLTGEPNVQGTQLRGRQGIGLLFNTLRKAAIGLLFDTLRTATVESATPMELLVIGKEDFVRIFMKADNPDEEPDHIQFIKWVAPRWLCAFQNKS